MLGLLDASWYRPPRNDWTSVRAAGFVGASLYLSNDPSKNIKPADVIALDAAGLLNGSILNWESTPGRPLQGAQAGHDDAVRANQEADAVHWPDTGAIYFSCDTNSTPGQVTAYYAAAKAVSKRPVGAYGGADTVVHLLWNGVTDYAWVANAGSWDHGVADVGAHLHQHYHTHNQLPTPAGWPLNEYDESAVLRPLFGQYGAAVSGAGVTPIRTPPEDHEMIRIIKGDQKPELWVTNWLTKRPIDISGPDKGLKEVAAIIAGGITDGAPYVTWPQHWVDNIPVEK